MSKIIYTGATGFVGTNFNSYFKDENELIPLSLRYIENQNINLDDADVIVHIGGKAHDLKQVSNIQAYQEANFLLTKQLFDSFLKSKCKKFIYLSSVKAVADYLHYELSEEHVPNPQTEYGKSKLAAENYILNQELPADKLYYIFRPCMIHGAGNKGNLNLLYCFIKRGIPYPLAAFQNTRSFLSIDNLCFILKEVITRNDIPQGIYNLADDEPIAIKDLINEIAKSMNQRAVLWKIPKTIILGMVNIGDKMRIFINTDKIEKLTQDYVVSNKKIMKVIDKKMPFTNIAGIQKTLASFYND